MIYRISTTFLLSFLVLATTAVPQKVTIEWQTDYLLQSAGSLTRNDSGPFRVEMLKFYVSDLSFYKEGKRVYSGPLHTLIDLTDSSKTIVLPADCPEDFNRIDFLLGIDSTTNTQGVLGDDLDPTNGMYWTWQSGYVNFKLEAVASHTLSPSRLEYHLGGYQQPYAAQRAVSLHVAGPKAVIVFNTQGFLASIPGDIPRHVMSPGREACLLSDLAVNAFSAFQP